MSAHVPLTRLIERTNDEGQRVLSGWLGKAKVIGHRGKDSADGSATWVLYLTAPDDRANEAKRRAWHKRQGATEAGEP